MTYTLDELRHKTVAELREIAKGLEHEAVKGYTQLNKQHLIEALCRALNVPVHAHHDVVGIDHAGVKAKIRALKAERSRALEARDAAALKRARRGIHRLKRRLRAAAARPAPQATPAP